MSVIVKIKFRETQLFSDKMNRQGFFANLGHDSIETIKKDDSVRQSDKLNLTFGGESKEGDVSLISQKVQENNQKLHSQVDQVFRDAPEVTSRQRRSSFSRQTKTEMQRVRDSSAPSCMPSKSKSSKKLLNTTEEDLLGAL